MHLVRRQPVVAFFALTYLLTWLPQGVAYVLARNAGFEISNEDNLGHLGELLRLQLDTEYARIFLIWLAGQFGPLVAAFALASVLYGGEGRRDLLRRMTKWRLEPRWYGLMLGVPVLMVAVSLAFALVSGGFSLGPFEPDVAWGAFPLFVLYMVLFTGLPEEPGWRGFALPHLQAQSTAARASWIVGIAWGVWHIPFTIYFNADDPLLVLPALVGLTIGIVGWTMVNTWFYNSTSSVLLVMLLHGWAGALQSYLVLSQPNAAAYTLYSLFPWAIAWYLSRRYGDEHLAAIPRPQWWPGRGRVESRGDEVSQSRGGAVAS